MFTGYSWNERRPLSLAIVDPDVEVAQPIAEAQESGPVVATIPVDAYEEAVQKANDSWAGLCGSVWSAG